MDKDREGLEDIDGDIRSLQVEMKYIKKTLIDISTQLKVYQEQFLPRSEATLLMDQRSKELGQIKEMTDMQIKLIEARIYANETITSQNQKMIEALSKENKIDHEMFKKFVYQATALVGGASLVVSVVVTFLSHALFKG